jgi:hypothetical protein
MSFMLQALLLVALAFATFVLERVCRKWKSRFQSSCKL